MSLRMLLALLLSSSGGCACLCDVEGALRARAGTGAIDCGHVLVGQDPSVAFDCVDGAIAAGHGVLVRWDQRGRDTAQAAYIAGHDGSFSFFHYGGALGGGCGELDEAPCDGPVTRSADGLNLMCVSSSSHVVCAN